MSTLRQQLSARRNGAGSRGPVTPEGKHRSSLNAIRHGLLANCLLLPDESREAFDEILAGFIAKFQPDDTELCLVEEMMAAMWRQRRAWAIENRLLDDAIAEASGRDPLGSVTAAFSTLAVKPQLDLINRYEVRLHRIYHRALDALLRLRRQKDQCETPPLPPEKPVPNEPDSPTAENLNSSPPSPAPPPPPRDPAAPVTTRPNLHLPARVNVPSVPGLKELKVKSWRRGRRMRRRKKRVSPFASSFPEGFSSNRHPLAPDPIPARCAARTSVTITGNPRLRLVEKTGAGPIREGELIHNRLVFRWNHWLRKCFYI